jgi:hypothetical protein
MAMVEMSLIGTERHGTVGETAWIVAGLKIEDTQ